MSVIVNFNQTRNEISLNITYSIDYERSMDYERLLKRADSIVPLNENSLILNRAIFATYAKATIDAIHRMIEEKDDRNKIISAFIGLCKLFNQKCSVDTEGRRIHLSIEKLESLNKELCPFNLSTV